MSEGERKVAKQPVKLSKCISGSNGQGHYVQFAKGGSQCSLSKNLAWLNAALIGAQAAFHPNADETAFVKVSLPTYANGKSGVFSGFCEFKDTVSKP
jgi:hypothetical protein